MKKHLFSKGVTAGILIAMAVAAAYAGTSAKSITTIPFGFTAGSLSYPAGIYTIAESETQGILVVSNARGRLGFIFTLCPESGDSHAKPRLVFRRYGDRFFLSLVSFGVEGGRILPMAPAEREFLKTKSNSLTRNELKPEMIYIDGQ